MVLSSRRAPRFFTHVARTRASVAVALFLTVPGVGSAQEIVLDAPVLYDRSGAWAGESAGMWCADPANPKRLIGVTDGNEDETHANIYRVRSVVKLSEDGGRTWKEVLRTNGAATDTDPACAFGVDGAVFVGAMAAPRGYHVWRSTDGGRTWSTPAYIAYPRVLDRAFLAVDLGDSRRHGRLYVAGAGMSIPRDPQPDEIVVYTSDDGGISFRGPTVVPTSWTGRGKGVTHMGQVVVLNDGTFVMSWTEAYLGASGWFCTAADTLGGPDHRCGASAIKIARSGDGGRSFEPALVVARGEYDLQLGNERAIFGKFYPALAADRSNGPFRNHLYVAWSNTANGRQEIQFSRSADAGLTWSAPRILNDDHAFDPARPIDGPHNAMVTLAVNRDGVLGVMWYALRAKLPSVETVPLFAASLDGGLTWSATRAVTSHAITLDGFEPALNIGSPVRGQRNSSMIQMRFPNYGGGVPTCNYGLTVDKGGNFRLFVFGNPSGHPEFNGVTAHVRGTPIVRIAARTRDLSVQVREFMHDTIAGELRISMALKNESVRTLPLPIRLTVETIQRASPGGEPMRILNADNGRGAIGAWWDIDGGDAREYLAPGQSTAPRTLRFRLGTPIRMSPFQAESAVALSFRPYLIVR